MLARRLPVVIPALLCSTLLPMVLRQCGSSPQLGLLISRKLSEMLCHRVVLDPRVPLFSWDTPTVRHLCVILDPRVSLSSLAEKVSLSLCFMCCSSRALLHEPLLSFTRCFPSRVLMTLPRHHPSFLATVFFFGQASCLVVNKHSSTPCVCALIDRSTRLVEPDCSLSCLELFWHRFIGRCSRLLSRGLTFLSFCTLALSVLPLR